MAHTTVVALMLMLAGVAMAQSGPVVNFIHPSKACPPNTLVSVRATSSYDYYGQTIITGSVLLRNGGEYDLPVTGITVQLINNIPVAPIFVRASCSSNSIPYSPQPYTYGQLICSFAAIVPADSVASDPSDWTTAVAKLILPGGATCSSGPTSIISRHYVYSSRNIGSNIGAAIGGGIAGSNGAALGGDIGGLIGTLAGAGSSSGASSKGHRKA